MQEPVGGLIVVGKFYVCGSDEDGELASLTEEEMEKYKERFWEPEEIDEACKIEIYFLGFLH